MPHSELNATVEVLDSLGVEPTDFERVRQNRVHAAYVAEAFKAGRVSAQVVEGRLLELVTIVQVPAVARFVACDYFKRDVSPEAAVKIAYVGDNFKAKFLGKTEVDVPAAELKVHRLCEDSLDAPIIAALGEHHETKLAHLWTLLSRQPNGERGILLVNGYANIFYVGILWAVDAGWRGGGWRVGARSVERPGGWSAGCRVFSC